MTESSSHAPPSRAVILLVGLSKVIGLTAFSVMVNLALVYPEWQRLNSQMSSLSSSISLVQTEISAHQIALDEHFKQLSLLSEELIKISQKLEATSQQSGPLIHRLQGLRDDLNEQIYESQRLSKRLGIVAEVQRKAANQKVTNISAVAPPDKKASTSRLSSPENKPEKALPTPFSLHDVQLRGVVYVAVISPKNAQSLSEVALLRQGERYQGWQVLSVLPEGVIIERDGQRLTLRSGV